MLKEIKPFLEEAGWYKGRRIEIDYMLSDFSREEYKEPNHLMKELFSEFWNIKVKRVTPEGFYQDIRLNTDEGMGSTSSDTMSQLERLVGIDFLPVGTINDDHAVLLLSFEAKFYLFADAGLFFLGDSISKACKKVLFREDLIKIAG